MEQLRESLEAAAAELTPAAPETPSVGVETSATPEPATGETSSTPAPETDSGRDANGRFTSKTTAGQSASQATPSKPPSEGVASSTQPPKAEAPAATEAPKPGETDATAAPQSWRLAARQDWEKAPPSVRQEVLRREQEVQKVLQQAAPARRLAQELERTFAPIAPSLQQRGVTPQRLIADYVRVDQALGSGDASTKAQAVAGLIKAYGVDIETLAKAIDGQLAAPPPREERFDPEKFKAQMRSEFMAEAEQRTHAQKVAEFSKAADPILFNQEVREDMAALIESAAARGVDLSLQDAYDRAIRANPEAWAIVQQREAAKLAATTQQATQRAIAAGSSVKSRPASPVGGESKGNSIGDDLRAVAAQLSGR